MQETQNLPIFPITYFIIAIVAALAAAAGLLVYLNIRKKARS